MCDEGRNLEKPSTTLEEVESAILFHPVHNRDGCLPQLRISKKQPEFVITAVKGAVKLHHLPKLLIHNTVMQSSLTFCSKQHPFPLRMKCFSSACVCVCVFGALQQTVYLGLQFFELAAGRDARSVLSTLIDAVTRVLFQEAVM